MHGFKRRLNLFIQGIWTCIYVQKKYEQIEETVRGKREDNGFIKVLVKEGVMVSADENEFVGEDEKKSVWPWCLYHPSQINSKLTYQV